MEEYNNFTLDELKSKKSELERAYNDKENECLKNGLSWDAACEKLKPIAIELYFIDKYMRVKKDPSMAFGRKWKGSLITIEKFQEMAKNGQINDSDNLGYYATEKGQSDIEIYPSDVEAGIMRDDFYYVRLYKK